MKNLNHKIPFQGQMKFMNSIFLVRDSQCTWTLKILSKLTLIIPDIQRLLDNFSFFSERFMYIFLFVNNIPDYCNQNQIHICTKVMKIKFTRIHKVIELILLSVQVLSEKIVTWNKKKILLTIWLKYQKVLYVKMQDLNMFRDHEYVTRYYV